jgi:hypothetical protein
MAGETAIIKGLGGFGTTGHRSVAGNATVQTVLSKPGKLHFIQVANKNAAQRFLHLYDTAGDVTVGTTTPTKTFVIPAGDGTNYGILFIDREIGMNFTAGIKFAITDAVDGSTFSGDNCIVQMERI